MLFIEILKYGFLVIFFATAAIGIASIPGWIKIEEWYKKKIFVVLILEVIGAIIILFRQEVLNIKEGASGVPDIEISDNNWTALDENGLIIQPKITIETQDTTITKQLGKKTLSELKGLSGKFISNYLDIVNSDDISFGNIPNKELKKLGLFNAFKTAKNEITSTENYSYIKWEKNPTWKKKGNFVGPFELTVYDYSNNTHYKITNTETKSIVFDTKGGTIQRINEDNRIIHFYKHNNLYYLIRIAWADLEINTKIKYVSIINARMEPTIQEKD